MTHIGVSNDATIGFVRKLCPSLEVAKSCVCLIIEKLNLVQFELVQNSFCEIMKTKRANSKILVYKFDKSTGLGHNEVKDHLKGLFQEEGTHISLSEHQVERIKSILC